MSVKITQKYELFKDVDGDPLENGYIYIGTIGLNPETSPITVYFDEALTLPASQPLRTSGGYIQNAGTPANVYVDTDYSITVRNKNLTLIYTSLSNNAEVGLASSVDTIGDLIGLDEATTTEELEVYGYHTKGDSAGGLFIWDSTASKSNANGGTIIDPSVSLANQGTGTGSGCWIRQHSGAINVKWFGAKGDGITNDSANIQRAVDYFISLCSNVPSVLFFPASKYLIQDHIDFTSTGGERRQIIGGDGFEVVEIIVDFNGYGADTVAPSAFSFGDEDNQSYQSAISINGFHFSKGSNCDRAPVGILGILAQSRINNITFGTWNNNTIRLISPQNCRFRDITMFSGGESFEYKDASAITVQQSGTTVTASGAIFSSADVGHTIAIWGLVGNTNRRKCKITGYTSSTQVTVDTSHTDSLNRRLFFGTPLVSISATSSTLTADANCFTAEHVGLYIYIKGAGENGGLLRSKIEAYVSTSSVTLSDNAVTTISDEEFTVPAVDIHSGAIGGPSDNTFTNLQIENHKGVGLCLKDVDIFTFLSTKIHGEQSATSDRYSIACIWGDKVQGFYQGSFDAQYLGEERIYMTNQTSCFTFEALTTRTAYDETIMRVGPRSPTFQGGIIQLDDISISGAYSLNADIENLIKDDNVTIAGYTLTGKVSFNEYEKTVQYSGNNHPGKYNETLTNVIWDGTDPANGTEQYRYSRIGNVVFFEMRLEYATAGANNSYITIPLPLDMPTPFQLPNNGDSELNSMLNGAISTSNDGTVAPALSKCYWRGDGDGTHSCVARLNSGTISAKFATISGMYFTKV